MTSRARANLSRLFRWFSFLLEQSLLLDKAWCFEWYRHDSPTLGDEKPPPLAATMVIVWPLLSSVQKEGGWSLLQKWCSGLQREYRYSPHVPPPPPPPPPPQTRHSVPDMVGLKDDFEKRKVKEKKLSGKLLFSCNMRACKCKSHPCGCSSLLTRQ